MLRFIFLTTFIILLRPEWVFACTFKPLFDKDQNYIACQVKEHGVTQYRHVPESECENQCDDQSASAEFDLNSQISHFKKTDLYQKLEDGNNRFKNGSLSHSNQGIERREALAGGQNPETIILTCSDSRVAPEIIFDQGLGDLFTIRIAGHPESSEVIASIEYAVQHLGSKALIVMGHERCGAIGAALKNKGSCSTGSCHIDALISKILPNVGKHLDTGYGEDLKAPVTSHTRSTISNLVNKSDIIKKAVASGKLHIVGALYALKTGEVEFLDSNSPSIASAYDRTQYKSDSSQTIDSSILSREVAVSAD